jgi:hypothetical protein
MNRETSNVGETLILSRERPQNLDRITRSSTFRTFSGVELPNRIFKGRVGQRKISEMVGNEELGFQIFASFRNPNPSRCSYRSWTTQLN